MTLTKHLMIEKAAVTNVRPGDVSVVAPAQLACPLPIDGVWIAALSGKRIHIQRGAASAVDAWRQLLVTDIRRGSPVMSNFKRTRPGVFAADDLVADAPATFRLCSDGRLSVVVRRLGGTLRYDMFRETLDNDQSFAEELSETVKSACKGTAPAVRRAA